MPLVLALALLAFAPLQARREPITPRPRAPELPGPVTLAGTLLDEGGVPLAGWTVGVQTEAVNLGRPEPLQATTGATGRFFFHEELGRRFALVLRSPDGGPVAIREDFALDGRPLLLRLEADERATGFPSPESELTDPLAEPGWIRVDVAHPGIELGKSDLVRTELLRDGRRRSGAVRNGPMAEVVLGRTCGFADLHRGEPLPLPPRGLSLPLAPGRYLLRTRSWRWRAADAWVEVRAGETSEVALTLVPATQQSVELQLPEGDPSIRVWLTVTSRDGAFRHEDWLHPFDGEFFADVDGLLPGAYHLEARSGSGRSLAADFEVLDLEAGEPLSLSF